MTHVPVLIAGGGPVGMTLARTLALHGVRCLLVERHPTTTRHPKMDITNGRSMELFRRLGVAGRLRAVAVPEENNFDISWITSLAREAGGTGVCRGNRQRLPADGVHGRHPHPPATHQTTPE